MTAIHWFRHDLRVEDNAALRYAAANSEALICVFVVDPRWFEKRHFQSCAMGQHRWNFLQQTLSELDSALQRLGSRLLVMKGDGAHCVESLINVFDVNLVTVTPHSGYNEMQQWHVLQERCFSIRFAERGEHTLFSQQQFDFDIDDVPTSFSKFRKKAEKLTVDKPVASLDWLPSPPKTLPDSIPIIATASPIDYLQGGESKGIDQMHHFMYQTHAIKQYKQTRNGFDGRDFSSKLSPWLANGSLSPRTVWSNIEQYEKTHGDNESTYWMKFELLWRDYFQWYALCHQKRLFKFSGIKETSPNTSFFPERFARWTQGNTPYPIVNACMKQLNETGYMSNRGRQLVASCLVHELELDWRFGAAYFEQQLIDFDVASNWGNWQYLAGVGADPRGHRKFDLDKQTQIYDPKREFIQAWNGDEFDDMPLDNNDIVDWPIKYA